jgi:hypothetical protein
VGIRVGLATRLGLNEHRGQLVGSTTYSPRPRAGPWPNDIGAPSGGSRSPTPKGTSSSAVSPAHDPPWHPKNLPGCRGGIVELHISAELLAALTGGGPGALPVGYARWAPVLTDIAAQYADRARILAQLDARPTDRFPHTALNRFLCTRDRTCIWPGCRRSAVNSHIDHTRDHSESGPTTQANTAPLRARHHHYKTAGAWTLRQTRPGAFEWTSPLGRVYRTRAEPLNPPPATRTPPANDPDPPPF